MAPPNHVSSDVPVGVLVVDDEPVVRSLLQIGLKRHGFHVWSAADGSEAVNSYRENRQHIAVVLLDVRMPGMDGPQTLDALRSVNADIPACFMTGDRGAYESDELLKHGAAFIVAKPFRLDELAQILRTLALCGMGAELATQAPEP